MYIIKVSLGSESRRVAVDKYAVFVFACEWENLAAVAASNFCFSFHLQIDAIWYLAATHQEYVRCGAPVGQLCDQVQGRRG